MIFLPKKISRVFLQVFFTVFISYFCLVNFNLKVSASEEIFISEVSFSGSVALNNCQLESGFVANLCNFDKWVELYNPSQNAINLDGWRIRVQGGLTQKLSGQIPAESFLVLSNNSYNYQAREKVVETFVPAERLIPNKPIPNLLIIFPAISIRQIQPQVQLVFPQQILAKLPRQIPL